MPPVILEHTFDETGHGGTGASSSAAQSPCSAPALGTPSAGENALHLLAELGDVQGHLDDLKRRLRELAEAS
jgi:hypothetical protein